MRERVMSAGPAEPASLDLAHGVPPNSMSYVNTLVNKTGSWKYIRPLYRDRVAPCNEGCPVGIDIEGYMNLLREGMIDEAVELLLRENPMPSVTGRVCYHPCETTCNRRRMDGAVAIHAVERLLGDEALKSEITPLPRLHPETVAIVGSGPAGLAAAYHLARLGYGVTLFEAAPEPGGVLRLGIPEYRLPKDVLAREIARITALGIELRCNARVGVNPTWDALDAFDAVFVATGVHRSQSLHVPGEDVLGIRSGLDFLKEVNFGGRPEIGPRVIVVGGGNTAMDCARTAIRLGNEVEVLYRRTRAEMPATEEEVQEAEEEGVVMQFLAAPVGVRASNGRLMGLECVRMRLGEADASGRRRPVPVENSNFFVPCDTVLTAIGESPDFEGVPSSLEHDDWVIKVTEFGEAKKPGWFAGGDIIEEPHTVAHALGAGKRAAIGIDHYLRGKAGDNGKPLDFTGLRFGRVGNVPITRWREDDPVHRNGAVNEVVPFEDLNLEHFRGTQRHTDRRLDIEESKRGFAEVNQGLSWGHGLDEARRCFNCGVCNRCELCAIYCPDLAISRREDGSGFDINYDYCKGCGICNAECPRGAMVMTREGL
ncbi:MAG TPA: NAD(P)-binding protein [Candidatus Eisenbacteria bacterium]|nr:NAD(P)-binding protein [Candidatus Eisenbacteria bacterium]